MLMMSTLFTVAGAIKILVTDKDHLSISSKIDLITQITNLE
jgi:hypothetical protein